MEASTNTPTTKAIQNSHLISPETFEDVQIPSSPQKKTPRSEQYRPWHPQIYFLLKHYNDTDLKQQDQEQLQP